MPFPALAAGVATGSNLLGTGFGILAERKRRQRMAKEIRAEALKTQALARQTEFSPSESLGRLEQGATRRTLSGLARRGVLDSSISAPEVASAVAPFEEQRQQRLTELRQRAQDMRLAAAAIQSGAPGLEDFLGGAMGDFGSLLALKAGYNIGQERFDQLQQMFSQFGGEGGGGDQSQYGGGQDQEDFSHEDFANATYIPR